LPIQLHRLRSAAYQRSTRLLFLPHHFSRHKTNTTYFRWKDRVLFWKVELVFKSDVEEVSVVLNRINESTTLSELLSNEVRSSLSHLSAQAASLVSRYLDDAEEETCMIMKKEKQSGKPRFHKLSLSQSLKDNLENKLIIEFPTFIVLFGEHLGEYDLLSPEEEAALSTNRRPTPHEIQNTTNGNAPPACDYQDPGKTDNDEGAVISVDLSKPPPTIPQDAEAGKNFLFETEFSESDEDDSAPLEVPIQKSSERTREEEEPPVKVARVAAVEVQSVVPAPRVPLAFSLF